MKICLRIPKQYVKRSEDEICLLFAYYLAPDRRFVCDSHPQIDLVVYIQSRRYLGQYSSLVLLLK
jgi:hypothetical protein